MTDRKVYWVVPHDSKWQVKHSRRVLFEHVLKAVAVAEGRRVAKANAPSQLKVMREDGTIEFESTYGHDPYPPEG
ncbi:DUF2188 domain-containing protein [Actinomadura litoris]|uniref:DUF2188 domain-containing protein n=1 Tax=Actinomadura litoris TaxID=2678616 RepID=UPI00156463EA|nr:DUF2188 domain-containing protein [Actinomadura litoris]